MTTRRRDLEVVTVTDGTPGGPEGREFTATLSVFGVEICTAQSRHPGDAARQAEKKFALALKNLIEREDDA